MKLTELDEGDFFGEMGLMNQEPRAADAVVLEDGTVLWRIEEKELDEIFSEAPSRVLSVMKGMTKRLRALTAEYLLACQTVAGLADAEPDALSEELRACMERCSGMFWDEPKQA